MQKFIFEWLSEEFPFKVQLFIQKELYKLTSAELQKVGISYGNLSILTSPRRFLIYLEEIQTPEKLGDIKGPKEEASDEVIQQFLKRVNKTKDELYIKKIAGRNYFFVEESKEFEVIPALKLAIENALHKINWPKNMHWGNYTIKCARPIIGLMALLDNKLVNIEYNHYQASHYTFGHRFLSEGKIFIDDVDDYFNKMNDHFVMINQNERKEKIKQLIYAASKEKGVFALLEEELLDEVNSLIDYPYLIMAPIPEFFFTTLPAELISVVMKNHQRFFSCVDSSGNIAPYFIAIINVPVNDGIINGYKKVLNARLSDAVSLMDTDNRFTIEDLLNKLKELTFHVKLGTFEAKVNRISTLAKYVALWINGASMINIEKAVLFSKISLVTNVVAEFPELEGTISAYHYLAAGNEAEIAKIIKEHTHPINAALPCTNIPEAAAIAIADKMDSLVGFIIAEESIDPTKDPLGIRRNAIGILRTIFENQIDVPLKLIIEKSISLFPQRLFASKLISKIKSDLKIDQEQAKKHTRSDIGKKVLSYFMERINAMLRHEDIKLEFLKNNQFSYHPLSIKNNAKFLKEFLTTDEGKRLLAVYKRLSHILNKNAYVPNYKVRKKLLKDVNEVLLAQKLHSLERVTLHCAKKNIIVQFIANVNEFTANLENFMDKVVVNDDNEAIKFNRLNLLYRIKTLFNTAIDFDLIIKNH